MFGIEVVLLMMLIRLLLPIGILLTIGEWAKRHEAKYSFE
jgi:hypothetical protein